MMDSSLGISNSYGNQAPEYSYHAYEYDSVRQGGACMAAEGEGDGDGDGSKAKGGKRRRRFLRIRSLFHNFNCCRPVSRLGKKTNTHGPHPKKTTQGPPGIQSKSSQFKLKSASASASPSFGYNGAQSWVVACGLHEEGVEVLPTTAATATNSNSSSSAPQGRLRWQRKNSKNSKEYYKGPGGAGAGARGGFPQQHDHHELLRAYEEDIDFDYDLWEGSDRYFDQDGDANWATFPHTHPRARSQSQSPPHRPADFIEINHDNDNENEGAWIQFNSLPFSPSSSSTREPKRVPLPLSSLSSKLKQIASPPPPMTPLGSSASGSPGRGTPATATDLSTTFDGEDGSSSLGDGDTSTTPKSNYTSRTTLLSSLRLIMPSFEEEEHLEDVEEEEEDEVDNNKHAVDGDGHAHAHAHAQGHKHDTGNDSNDSASISIGNGGGSKSSSDMDGYSYSAISLPASSTAMRNGRARSVITLTSSARLEREQQQQQQQGESILKDPPKTIRAGVKGFFRPEKDKGGNDVDVNVSIDSDGNLKNHPNDSDSHSATGLSNYMSIFYPDECFEFEGIVRRSDNNNNPNQHDFFSTMFGDSASQSRGEDGATLEDDFSDLYDASFESI